MFKMHWFEFPLNSKQNLADEWLWINRSQPVIQYKIRKTRVANYLDRNDMGLLNRFLILMSSLLHRSILVLTFLSDVQQMFSLFHLQVTVDGRLEKPSSCPDDIYKLMLNCWCKVNSMFFHTFPGGRSKMVPKLLFAVRMPNLAIIASNALCNTLGLRCMIFTFII